jgi:hypothetical protein
VDSENLRIIAMIILALSTYDFPFLAWSLDKLARISGWLAWFFGNLNLHARLAYYEVV